VRAVDGFERWNSTRPVTDYRYMRAEATPHCDDIRVDLSARLDGEATNLTSVILDTHVRGCVMCQTWLAGAERVTRTVRVQPVAVPDLTAQILTALQADGTVGNPATAKRRDWQVALRWALGGLAVVQLMLAVPDLLGAAGHDAHSGREVAALQIALAVGLLVAACYPEYARVFAPVAIILVICFAAISTLDMMEGTVTTARVAGHLLTLAQAALVWFLARGVSRRPAII